jgi:hypothetical protein
VGTRCGIRRMRVAGVGNVSLITIIAVVSRLKVESYPCLDTTNPPLEAYQLVLRRAFLTTGLSRRITLDHGTVLYENTSPSPFPTRLHLWLLALGIDVCFTLRRCPTDHAATRANSPNHDATSPARPALAGSTGVMGRPGRAPRHAQSAYS